MLEYVLGRVGSRQLKHTDGGCQATTFANRNRVIGELRLQS